MQQRTTFLFNQQPQHACNAMHEISFDIRNRCHLLERADAMAAAEEGKNVETMDGAGQWQRAGLLPDTWPLCYRYRRAPEPVTRPFIAADVKPGWVFRLKDDAECKWRTPLCVAERGIVFFSVFGPKYIPFKEIHDHWIVSRDGGETWGPCSITVSSISF